MSNMVIIKNYVKLQLVSEKLGHRWKVLNVIDGAGWDTTILHYAHVWWLTVIIIILICWISDIM